MFYAIWFLIQPWMLSHGKNSYKYSLLLKCIGPLSSWCLNYWRDGTNDHNMYGLFCMVNYDLMFMCQGLVDQTYNEMQRKSRGEWAKTMVGPA